MIKFIIPISLLLIACNSSETTPFCECVQASEALNNAQVELIDNHDQIANADPAEMKNLRDAKSKACADYEMISGEEAKALKGECNEN